MEEGGREKRQQSTHLLSAPLPTLLQSLLERPCALQGTKGGRQSRHKAHPKISRHEMRALLAMVLWQSNAREEQFRTLLAVSLALVLSCLVSLECTLWEGFFWRVLKQAYTVPCRASHPREQGAQVLCT